MLPSFLRVVSANVYGLFCIDSKMKPYSNAFHHSLVPPGCGVRSSHHISQGTEAGELGRIVRDLHHTLRVKGAGRSYAWSVPDALAFHKIGG